MRRLAESPSKDCPILIPIHGISTTNRGVFKGKTIDGYFRKGLFGVVVELVGTGRAYVTSPSGYFKLEGIAEGVYVVRFTYPGFASVEEVIEIQEGEILDLTVEFEREEE
jgi:hypothetical protein